MKKILTIVYVLHKGGTERVAQNFAEAYLLLGHDSRVLVTEELGVRADELKTLGIKIYEFNNDDMEQIKLWSPDIVHVHSLGMKADKVNLFFDNMLPEIQVVESNVFSTPSPYEQYLDVSLQLSEWCNWIYNKQKHDCKSLILPNPVNTKSFYRSAPDRIESFRHKYGIHHNEIVLGRIGQSFVGKWSDMLVDLFCELCKTFDNLKLLVVNPSEPVYSQISVQSSDIRDKIIIINQIIGDDSLRDCYSSIDIFIHIADQGESFGLVLTEAMLCEVPVVTYSTPWGDNSQCEIVGNGKGGLVVTNYYDLRRATVTLIQDLGLRKSLGNAGRESVIAKYDSILVVRKLISLLSDNIDCQCTENETVSKIYKDVYGCYSKVINTLLKIAPTGITFHFFRHLLLFIAKYGLLFPFNLRFLKLMLLKFGKVASFSK